jgi:hypothetical protein
MKIKVSEATPRQLDWMVAKCEGAIGVRLHTYRGINPGPAVWVVDWEREPGAHHWVELSSLDYSTNWAQGGSIIEREDIAMSSKPDGLWAAYAPQGTKAVTHAGQTVEVYNWTYKQCGYTPLIAAMRCYVASKLGDTIEIPEELK